MSGIKDWVVTQLLSNPLSFSTSFFSVGDDYFRSSDTNTSNNEAEVSLGCPEPTVCVDRSQEHNQLDRSVPEASEPSATPNSTLTIKDMESLVEVEKLRTKFLRLLKLFRLPLENFLVAKVLHRIHIATLVRADEADLKRIRHEREKISASEQGPSDPIFSIRILVIGKTGSGKSSTINSLLNEAKIQTNAFKPATHRIHEVSGTINGAQFVFIDTPGFLPTSTANIRRNRKIMMGIRRFINKSPPDVVLFCERIDFVASGFNDTHLFKLMNDIFGREIWFNTILVMTHASFTPGEPNDYYTSNCSNIFRSIVHQSVADSSIENHVVLVENQKNAEGEALLADGSAWKPGLFLLCICTKLLAAVNVLLGFQGSITLGPQLTPRVPSLPHLVSSLLRHQPPPDDYLHQDTNEEDEFDKLPPIRILTKSQFDKMTQFQKREYLNELDYRETLFLKKQMKKEAQKPDEENPNPNPEEPEAVLVSDIPIPPSFDPESPTHRYRYLLTNERCVTRPVFEPQGWDHDAGFDGINIEITEEVKKDIHLSLMSQMSKDKRGFSCHSECNATCSDPKRPLCSLEMELQSASRGTICTARSNVKIKALKMNVIGCNMSVTSFNGKCYIGAKVENAVLIGNRVRLMMNVGQVKGNEQMGYGGSFEAFLKGTDYPVRNDFLALILTAISSNNEVVYNGGVKTEFRPSRTTKFAVDCSLNSRKMGQATLKLSSCGHVEIAALGFLSVLGAFYKGKSFRSLPLYE